MNIKQITDHLFCWALESIHNNVRDLFHEFILTLPKCLLFFNNKPNTIYNMF